MTHLVGINDLIIITSHVLAFTLGSWLYARKMQRFPRYIQDYAKQLLDGHKEWAVYWQNKYTGLHLELTKKDLRHGVLIAMCCEDMFHRANTFDEKLSKHRAVAVQKNDTATVVLCDTIREQISAVISEITETCNRMANESDNVNIWTPELVQSYFRRITACEDAFLNHLTM